MRISTTIAVSAVNCFGSVTVTAAPTIETRVMSASTSHLRAQMMRRIC